MHVVRFNYSIEQHTHDDYSIWNEVGCIIMITATRWQSVISFSTANPFGHNMIQSNN